MDREQVKPPWTRIQWRSQVPKPTATDHPEEGEWQEEHFEEIEKLKESIQPYDRTELWDLAKRITNPFELISTHSSRLKLPKSTCCLYPLSRSFFKMIEMIEHLNFFERHKEPKLKSLHICEGPGGFIEAFHNVAERKNRIIQSSHAMTLRSTHTMIPGWRRATQFLQKHPNISLLYGPQKTGDIYDPANQKCCMESVGQGGVHLATADGGFDFSDDFHAQERNILRLLVSSAVILLECVAHEGDIVLKVFDCNATATRDLIYILASCFKSWTLYKPVTSRPCNSEWYFMGRSALMDRREPIRILKEIRDGLAKETPVMYRRLVATNPLEADLRQMQGERCEQQMKALKEVLSFCKNKDTISQEALWQSQRSQTAHWCSAFHMPFEFKPQL